MYQSNFSRSKTNISSSIIIITCNIFSSFTWNKILHQLLILQSSFLYVLLIVLNSWFQFKHSNSFNQEHVFQTILHKCCHWFKCVMSHFPNLIRYLFNQMERLIGTFAWYWKHYQIGLKSFTATRYNTWPWQCILNSSYL